MEYELLANLGLVLALIMVLFIIVACVFMQQWGFAFAMDAIATTIINKLKDGSKNS